MATVISPLRRQRRRSRAAVAALAALAIGMPGLDGCQVEQQPIGAVTLTQAFVEPVTGSIGFKAWMPVFHGAAQPRIRTSRQYSQRHGAMYQAGSGMHCRQLLNRRFVAAQQQLRFLLGGDIDIAELEQRDVERRLSRRVQQLTESVNLGQWFSVYAQPF